MVRTKTSKLVDVKKGTSDQALKSLKKSVRLQEKNVSKVVKDVAKKLELISDPSILHYTKSLGSLSTASSKDSDDVSPSAVLSGWTTPGPIAPPLRKTRSIPRIAKPFRLYKIKRPESSETVEVIHFNSNLLLSSSTETDHDEYDQAEEDILPRIEDEKTDPLADLTSLRESQLGLSSDSDIRMRYELLHQLRDIPSCDELSATATPDSFLKIEKKELKKEDENLDIGKFKDPLGRHSMSTVEDDDVPTELYNEDLSQNLEPAVRSLHDISSSELESDDDSLWELKAKLDNPSPIPIFIQNPSGFRTSESSLPRVHDAFSIAQVVQGYLIGIIDKVVDKLEKRDILRANKLDKNKLLDRLIQEVDDNNSERYTNEYLTKRITDYYLRRYKYSLVTPSTSSSIQESNRRRYYSALNELDNWLKQEQNAEELLVAEKGRLLGELEQMQAKDIEKVEGMENLFRKTLLGRNQNTDRLKFVVEAILRQMRRKRDLMSETRFDLIIKQHNTAYVKQKLDETETISGEVKMNTYLSMETIVQQLANTLNNRNVDLLRMYSLVKKKIHTISHLRCRRKLLNRKFRVAKEELLVKQKRHSELRDKVYANNLTHNKLLAKIKEARRRGGIMCYPKLLADYDHTVNFIQMKKSCVQELKARHDNLLRKIDKIEYRIHDISYASFSK
ncbi:uncharacterized protein LOC108111334 [Drosophila eugracilis]|uniref:uncharacterized protein LOC108111334 n=1 Tax=Drosophila eugracilis TaxID=29029 RepID=UPI001BD99971|nr:uncharacterized protein LOC108111334 [Drosophila eugracilis]